MAKINYLIAGQNLGEPRNWENLEITFDWLEEKQEGNINTNTLAFTGPAYRYLVDRLNNGLTGGVGIFEGVPLTLQVGQPGNPVFEFDGYIDGTDDATFIGKEEIVAKIKKRHGDDWLNEVADGFSFAYLYDIGEITNSDFKKVPYIINYVPDTMQMIVLGMSLFMMVREVVDNVQKITHLVAEAVNAATPVVGVSVGFGGGVVTAWDLGDWVGYAVKVIANLLYTIAINIAIYNLFKELVEQLFPAKRNHLGMEIKTLLKKGLAHVGLTLESNLLDSDFLDGVVYIPLKDRKGGSNGERGFPTNGDPIYIFGDAIRVFKKMFHADYKITGNVFRFERSDYWETTSGFVLPNVFSDQSRLLNQYIPNTKEFTSNYNIVYEFDRMDMNTLDDTTGLAYQVVTKPVSMIDPKLVLMKGLTQIQIPFALGKRKDGLTDFEEFAKDIFRVVDNITGIFGGGTNFAHQVEARVGCMMLSSHFITVPKLVKMNGGKLTPDQRVKLGAKAIWENFHVVASFVEINGRHNQWLRMPPTRVPIMEDDLLTIFDNNFINTADGKVAMIEKLIWRPEKGTAVISYRINEKYTNNLKLEYVG